MVDRIAPAGNIRSLTAVVVTRVGADPILSPFFDRSDGVLLIDEGTGARDFRCHDRAAGLSICDLLGIKSRLRNPSSAHA
jgi:hypothetical protein